MLLQFVLIACIIMCSQYHFAHHSSTVLLFLTFTDSVLSAEQIIRLSISEFRCTLPTMNFFGTKIQPILYVDVHVYPEFNKSEIVVLRAETAGSETAIKVNGTFNIQATNVVSAGISIHLIY